MRNLGPLALVIGLGFAPASEAATGYSIGSMLFAKTTASSTGAPCEQSCWELWQISNFGSLMVVKDGTGALVKAGRMMHDPELLDMYQSTDEAYRKIPNAQQIARYGYVIGTSFGTNCTSSCAVLADFGFGQIELARNAASGLVAATGLVQPMGGPLPVLSDCKNRNAPAACSMRYGSASGSVITSELIIYFDEDGNVIKVEVKVNGITVLSWEST